MNYMLSVRRFMRGGRLCPAALGAEESLGGRRGTWNGKRRSAVFQMRRNAAGKKEGEQEEDVFVTMKGRGLNEGSC